jgi:succinate dehydrogenase/fumarate reductase cytochrome b subunit
MANPTGASEARANQAAREVKKAAPSGWLEPAARIGYAAKGIVYTVIGVLALQAAFGSGGKTTGSKGALQRISGDPFGQVLLVIIGVGLAGYALWRLAMAILDPKHEGTGAKALVKRLGYAVSGIVNGAVAFSAFRLLAGSGGGSGGSGSKQQMTAQLMSQPFGRWLVGIGGAIVVAVGLYHFYRAAKAKFMEKYNLGEMSRTEKTGARRIGRLGMVARGVAFAMIGCFFAQAALQAQPDEAGGLGKVFNELIGQPYGPWLMALLAAGLVCYAVYCFSYARYRHVEEA